MASGLSIELLHDALGGSSINQDEPPCWRAARLAGGECSYCSGEACGLCGAGQISGAPPCDHDVIDRHRGPFYVGPRQ